MDSLQLYCTSSVILIILVTLFWFQWKRKRAVSSLQLPPGPSAWHICLSWTMKLFGMASLSDYHPLSWLVDHQSVSRQIAKHMKRLYGFIDVSIQDRIAIKNTKHQHKVDSDKDFLEVLLDMRSEDFNLFDELLLAGTDSTTTAVEWVMAELIRNPDKMKLVKQELDGIIGLERKVGGCDIDRLLYLDAVVKETFQLHPTPLLVPRKAGRDCEIEGYVILVEAQVMVNLWGLGRDSARLSLNIIYYGEIKLKKISQF